MDDQRFDKMIKDKLAEYEDPRFDSSALAALHQQTASLPTSPCYSRYIKEWFIVSGMILCTLVLLWSQWYFNIMENKILKENTTEVFAQRERIKNLTNEITELRNHPTETLRITELRQNLFSPSYAILLNQMAALQETLRKMQTEVGPHPSPVSSVLSDANSGESSFRSSHKMQNDHSYFSSDRLRPRQKKKTSAQANHKNIRSREDHTSPELSPETLRKLEKHYQKGIGIRVGPTVEVSRGFYDVGKSRVDFAGGVLGDFILSPTLSLETGAKFSQRFYEISAGELADRPFPNVDKTLGPLSDIEVDSWILEAPINLKYRYPINIKTNWIGGIGYSFLIYTRQVFEYDYSVDGNPTAQLNTSTDFNRIKLFPGNLNISLGFGYQLKNKKILETSLYYQHGLGHTGVEKVKASFLGIRSAYWFTLK